MTVEECKRRMKFTEFLKWSRKLSDEWTEHKKSEYLLANLAWHVYLIPHRLFGGEPSKKYNDFLDGLFTRGSGDEEEYQMVKSTTTEKVVVMKTGDDYDEYPIPGKPFRSRFKTPLHEIPSEEEEALMHPEEVKYRKKMISQRQQGIWFANLGLDATGKPRTDVWKRKDGVQPPPNRNNPVILKRKDKD